MRNMSKLIFGIVALLIVMFIVSPFIPAPSYSDGNRVGFISKFSHKGIFFKSYEGEMNLGGLRTKTDDEGNRSVEANIFEFSVTDPRIVDQINDAMVSGHSVELTYTEKLWRPYNASTAYLITAVKILDRTNPK